MVLGHPKIQYFESKIREREICIYLYLLPLSGSDDGDPDSKISEWNCSTMLCKSMTHMHSHYQVCLVTDLTYMVWTVDGLHLGLQQTEN